METTLEELAHSFDCITEQELCLLAGITQPSCEAWRKRHKGPDYILFGNTFLYPKAQLRSFLMSRLRQMDGPIVPLSDRAPAKQKKRHRSVFF